MAVDLAKKWKHASSLNTNLSATSCRRSWNSKQNSWVRAWSSCNRYGLQASRLRRIRQSHVRHFQFSACETCWFLRTPGKGFSYGFHSLRRWPWPACSFCGTEQPVTSTFLFHSLIVLSVGGYVWYLVRQPRCTVIIDSVLASCKIKKFCSPENVLFSHYYLLVEKRVTKPLNNIQEENPIISLFIEYSRPLLASLSLRYRPPNSWRELWNTLYVVTHVTYRNCTKLECFMPITVAARSNAWTVFAHLNARVMGSNPTRGIDVCVYVYSVFVLSSVYVAASRRADHPSKVSYRPSKKILRNSRRSQGLTRGCRVIAEWMNGMFYSQKTAFSLGRIHHFFQI
jgi:hypothetical protein